MIGLRWPTAYSKGKVRSSMGERFALRVTESEIVYRLNRAMAAEGLKVMGPKTIKQQNLGDWFVIDMTTGKLVAKDVDLTELALDWKVLEVWEKIGYPGDLHGEVWRVPDRLKNRTESKK